MSLLPVIVKLILLSTKYLKKGAVKNNKIVTEVSLIVIDLNVTAFVSLNCIVQFIFACNILSEKNVMLFIYLEH